MLDDCAPGHVRKAMPHDWKITYNGYTFPSLPLGRHGRRENPAIEIGHIKKMARSLHIYDCARNHLNF